jgi:hypothetical protein
MNTVANTVADAKAWWKSKTFIGTIMMIAPYVIRLIDPSLTLDIEAGVGEVFTQAELIANHADSAWVTISQSLGAILTAVGIRTAKQPIKGFA